MRCSAGTYVRALARDLGERLGTGAHLMALRRTRSGGFDIGQAVPGDQLEGAAERLVPLSGLLLELPAVVVGEEGRRRIGHGRELGPEHVLSGFPGPRWSGFACSTKAASCSLSLLRAGSTQAHRACRGSRRCTRTWC